MRHKWMWPWIAVSWIFFIYVACTDELVFDVDLPDERVDTLLILDSIYVHDSILVIDSIPVIIKDTIVQWHFDTTVIFHTDTVVVTKRLPPGFWCVPEYGEPVMGIRVKYSLWRCPDEHNSEDPS